MSLRKWILVSVLFSMLVGCGGPWSSGDRVLVSKCAFDNGMTGPHRYDVVVFKFPVQPVKNGTPTNYNIYLNGNYNHQREVGNKTIYEGLMYSDLNTGEIIPWQAESFTNSADFLSVTVKLRKGITWADGEPFTSQDVKFTLEMLRRKKRRGKWQIVLFGSPQKWGLILNQV